MRVKGDHLNKIETALSSGGAAKSSVVASWSRSARLHGLDPTTRRKPERLDQSALTEARSRAGRMIQLANPVLDELFRAVGGMGACVLLADEAGVPVDRRGTRADDVVFDDWGLWLGAIWSEEMEGTNGIGTCLAEGRQVTIHRDEHFYARNTGLSCMDAPIWGPDGRLIAALDISSARTDHTERLNALIAAQVAHSARAIEAAFFRVSFPGARIVTPEAVGTEDGSLLLAVDKDDLAIGANRAARRAFGLEKEGQLRPRPASDLLGRQDEATGFERAERAAVIRALARAEGNVSAAARALGVGRATLYRRMQRLGIDEKPGRLSHG